MSFTFQSLDIHRDDPTLAIPWPLMQPVISEGDRGLPRLDDAEAAS